ncbi:MAG: hypothetical protein ACMXYG_01805 [Candidatus Woesearchaeota archaeon]
MNQKLKYSILFILFILSIILRITIGPLQTFSDDESYYTLRQLESIQNTGKLLYNDELSYSGRQTVISPAFYYILAFFSIFLMDNYLIIITAIFASLTVFIIYLISQKITKNSSIAILVSTMSIFIPVYLINTTNTLSPITLSIPLSLYTLYLFSNIKTKKDISFFIGFFTLLCITSALSLLVTITIILFLLTMKIEQIKIKPLQKEIAIFSIFVAIWSQILIYKNAFLIHGPGIIWQNLPQELYLQNFAEINILKIIYFVGVVPFSVALYIIYKKAFSTKEDYIYLYGSLTAITTLMLVFRLIELQIGLIYLGFCFIIFFGIFIKNFIKYIEKTKLNNYKQIIIGIIIFIFLISGVIPSIALINNQTKIPPHIIDAMQWIKENTNEDSIILGTISEGHLISSIARRKNVIDGNFLMINDIDQRIIDIRNIYISPSVVKAIELAEYYNIDYILFDNAKNDYRISNLRYENDECFKKVYNNISQIYQVLCKVEIFD